MGYKKTKWQSGDVVTSTKLNKIEDALESLGEGVYDHIIHVTATYNDDTGETTYESDTTYAQAYEWADADKPILLVFHMFEIYGDEVVDGGIDYYKFIQFGNSDDIPLVFSKDSVAVAPVAPFSPLDDILTLVGGRNIIYFKSDETFEYGSELGTIGGRFQCDCTKEGNTYTLSVISAVLADAFTAVRVIVNCVEGNYTHEMEVVSATHTNSGGVEYKFLMYHPEHGLMTFTSSLADGYPTCTVS